MQPRSASVQERVSITQASPVWMGTLLTKFLLILSKIPNFFQWEGGGMKSRMPQSELQLKKGCLLAATSFSVKTGRWGLVSDNYVWPYHTLTALAYPQPPKH